MNNRSLVELPRGTEWFAVLMVDMLEVELYELKLVSEFDLLFDMYTSWRSFDKGDDGFITIC